MRENSHEVVDGNTANTPDPRLHVAEANVEVLPDAVLGDGAGDVHVEQVVGRDVDVLAADEELVGSGHVLVEDLGGDGREGGVRDPGSGGVNQGGLDRGLKDKRSLPVVAGADLAELVGADVVHGLVVGGLVLLDRDLGRHAAHGVDAALMARLDEGFDLGKLADALRESRKPGDPHMHP